MKISILCLSPSGMETALAIQNILQKEHETEIFRKGAAFKESAADSVHEWTEKHFHEDALIYVCAAGIAVRAIAPFVKSKKTDPAVLVVDDRFQYVIPILSGHLGGANRLASQIADGGNAAAIITTSTDIHGKFAPDLFARKNNLVIADFVRAKEAAAALVRGERVAVYCDSRIVGKIPEEAEIRPLSALKSQKDDEWAYRIIISPYTEDGAGRERSLWLIPKTMYLGIGLKEGKSEADVEKTAGVCMAKAGISPLSVKKIASINLKEKEQGLHAYRKKLDCGIVFFSGEELRQVPGEFTESAFVQSVAGVGNVCERSALLAAMEDGEKGEAGILERKLALEGVTAAIAEKKGKISFE